MRVGDPVSLPLSSFPTKLDLAKNISQFVHAGPQDLKVPRSRWREVRREVLGHGVSTWNHCTLTLTQHKYTKYWGEVHTEVSPWMLCSCFIACKPKDCPIARRDSPMLPIIIRRLQHTGSSKRYYKNISCPSIVLRRALLPPVIYNSVNVTFFQYHVDEPGAVEVSSVTTWELDSAMTTAKPLMK